MGETERGPVCDCILNNSIIPLVIWTGEPADLPAPRHRDRGRPTPARAAVSTRRPSTSTRTPIWTRSRCPRRSCSSTRTGRTGCRGDSAGGGPAGRDPGDGVRGPRGQFDDAKLDAAGSNGTHGLRMTNADKRRAAQFVLRRSGATAGRPPRRVRRFLGDLRAELAAEEEMARANAISCIPAAASRPGNANGLHSGAGVGPGIRPESDRAEQGREIVFHLRRDPT